MDFVLIHSCLVILLSSSSQSILLGLLANIALVRYLNILTPVEISTPFTVFFYLTAKRWHANFLFAGLQAQMSVIRIWGCPKHSTRPSGIWPPVVLACRFPAWPSSHQYFSSLNDFGISSWDSPPPFWKHVPQSNLTSKFLIGIQDSLKGCLKLQGFNADTWKRFLSTMTVISYM